ncbi:MAG: lipid-A-disaccharide synthase [Rhizobiaceae bacterium]|nr:lipid-A-disaccharide synthase [Rhizobiaceae bacterium]
MSDRRLTLAIIAGEESGDILGADLVRALRRSGTTVDLVGTGGPHLHGEGLDSLFDPDEIALMGLSAIVRRLPRLLRLIGKTARAVIAAKPDALVIIDSPEFSHRVARKVKAALPSLPVFNYVCPSVWAWRSHRAANMRDYIDEVWCLLPFEPGALKALAGPPGVFVGHRISHDADVTAVRAAREARTADASRQLLLLPGSRRGEIDRLLPDMLETARLMLTTGAARQVSLATLPRHEARVRGICQSHGVPVDVVSGEKAKWSAFAEADAALAASGTVLLELAMAGVPCASVYRLDWMAKRFLSGMIEAWSAALPNLISDRVVVPEHFEEYFRPVFHARLMTGLMDRASPQHKAQQAGFAAVADAMKTQRPAADTAAGRIFDWLDKPAGGT